MKQIYLLLFLGLAMAAQAVPVKELQELRLAKAELALSQGNNQLAMQYIKQNINQKYFHFESYLFMMEFYQKNKFFTKALRVSRYLIKKLHNRAFLKMSNMQQLIEITQKVPKPSDNALLLYFKLGQLFYDMWQSNSFSDLYKKKLFSMSLKYFSICYHYQFSPMETNYYLAILKREKREYYQAIDHLIQMQELLDDHSVGEQKDQIDFLIADSLIREGYTDAGTIYLRSIQASAAKYSQIKEYATNYLDSFASRNDFFSMALNYGIVSDSNANDLNNDQLDRFASLYKPTYKEKSATLNSYGFDSIASFSLGRYWTLRGSGYFSEAKAKNRDLYFIDNRDWGTRIEIKYFNLIKSQLKLTYSFSNTQEKTPGNHSFYIFSKSHLFQLQYTHILKSGMISYTLPITKSQYPLYNDTQSYGFSLSYAHFRRTPLWAPSYSAIIQWASEYEPGIADSLQISGTISNYMLFNDNISCLLWSRILNNQNAQSSHSYFLTSLNAELILLTPFSKKLTFNAGTSWQVIKYQNNTHILKTVLSLKISYLFD